MRRGAEDDRRLKRLGRCIAHFRKQKAMAQEVLAAEADLDRTYISAVERGRRNPTAISLWRIASALGLPLSAIIAAVEADSDL